MSANTFQDNPYFIDPSNAAEMARLILQDRLFTTAMGGVFPHPLAAGARVLDVGCGPGGWLLDLADQYLEAGVTAVGIDLDETMISYARGQAQASDLENVTFEILDLRTMPWPFPDASFDVVNARFLAFFPPSFWPKLLQEYVRLSKPGGVIRLTETEATVSNSPAVEQEHEWFFQALWKSGQSFSANGHRLTITAMLAPLLRQAGLHNVQTQAYGIDWSYGTQAHAGMCEDSSIVFQLVEPFYLNVGVATPDELERTSAQMRLDMQQPSFAAMHYLLSAWGTK